MASEKETADMRRWVEGWKEAGAALEKLRREELSRVDVRQAIEDLDDAFEADLRASRKPLTSGLIQQQAWFAKARK